MSILRKHGNQWIFLTIAIVCLISLFLPTRLDIAVGTSISPYKMEIRNLLSNTTVFLAPDFSGNRDIFSYSFSGFDVKAIINYPKYYIGLIVALILAILGLVNTKSEVKQ